MAPGVLSSKFAYDDFVPTIEDDESDVPDLDAEDDANDTPQVNGVGQKRKREDDPQSSKGQSKKKSKKRKQAAESEEVEEVDTGEAPQAKNDRTFNDEFEFFLASNVGVVEGFGDWALAATPRDDPVSGGRRALGIDEIVARRKAQKKDSPAEVDDADEADDSGSEQEMNGFAGFEDEGDETLAEDAFGMGVVDDEDEEDEDIVEGDASNSAADEDEDEDNEDAHGANGKADDENEEDNDSEAEPVPHPDDALYLDMGDEEAERFDPKEAEKRAAFYAPEDMAGENEPLSKTSTSFQTMSLSRPILKGLATVGFTVATPIQVKTIPVALMGKDVVGGAETGSGKTAAFMIPILERLLYRPRKVPTTRVAILMPTRELAAQCYNVAIKLATFTDISFALIVGGLSLREQEQTLKKRPDVVIATPGRFIDHMRNSASFKVENLEILVLDEADRMLDDGFEAELSEILQTIPRSRQTMLFSATMTEDLDKLIRVGLNRPVRLLVDAKKQTVQGLVQEFIKMKGATEDIDDNRRLAYLLHLCKNTYVEKTIIFFPRKVLAHRVKVLFSLQGIKAAELHGSMSQEQRLGAISAFREGQCTHLLATDLASRGLDIPRVETVINFTVPTSTTTYLHRVGRTARAGRQGVACTLFSAAKGKGSAKTKQASERTLLKPILRIAKNQGAKIRTRNLPSDTLDDVDKKVTTLQEEIDAVLEEEKEERLLQQSERDVTKGENLVKYEDEIASRPRRTWFLNEKDKQAESNRGKEERKGVVAAPALKGEKKKLSGKEKKQLLSRDERVGASKQGWKKGKEERSGRGVLAAEKDRKREKKQTQKKNAVGKPDDGRVTKNRAPAKSRPKRRPIKSR